jgi:hypothetical protein
MMLISCFWRMKLWILACSTYEVDMTEMVPVSYSYATSIIQQSSSNLFRGCRLTAAQFYVWKRRPDLTTVDCIY